MTLPATKPTRKTTVGDLDSILQGLGDPYLPRFAEKVNGATRTIGKPHFTGFRPFFEGISTATLGAENVVEVPCDVKPVMVGHWLWLNPRDERGNLQVAVPGFTFSIYSRGSMFEMGTERFALDAPRDLMDKACQVGYAKLLQLIADMESGKLDEDSIA